MNEKALARLEGARKVIARDGLALATMGEGEVAKFVKRFGTSVAAIAFGVSSDRLRGLRTGETSTPRRRQAVEGVIDLMERLQDSLRRDKKRELVDDVGLAVPLHTLPPGSRFKTPDSVEERIPGLEGVLIHAYPHRASVRLGAARHVSITVREEEGDDSSVEFDRPGKAVNIAAGTMVVPIASQ